MTSQSQTEHSPGNRPERIPGKVKWLIAVLWFQTAGNAFGTVVVFLEAQIRADHGQEGAGVLRGIGVLSLLAVVFLAMCAIVAVRGISWGWWLTLVLEIVAIVNGLIVLVSGNVGAFLGIALAVGVISLLNARQTKDWYGRY